MPDLDHLATRPEDKVPLQTKVAFGAANMVGIFTGNLSKELLNPVYVVTLGLSPALVGMAMVIFRLYDAVIDPIMGWLSDNTRTRWGRRRPYLLAGAFLCALMMPIMWLVNPHWSHFAQVSFLIGTGIILFTAMTIYGVPYESFSLELTPDYKERTRVASYKLVISSVAGLVIGWSWFITQLPMFSNPVTHQPDTVAGALGLSVFAGILIVIFGLGPVFFARERFYAAASKQAKVSLLSVFSETLTCRPFLILSAVALCAVTGSGLINGIGFFTRLYYVSNGDVNLAAKLNGLQSTLWMPISIAAVFLFQMISNRWSKTHGLYVAMILSLASAACRWSTNRPDMPYLSLTSGILLAIGMTGMWQMLPAMNADVVDADELHSASRREGAFAAIFSWFMKLSYTVGIGMPGIIVGWCGFVADKGNIQPPNVLLALRLCDAFVPSILILVSIVLLIFYPLSVHRMTEIRRELEARRGHL